jgi:hypothetical protein
MTQPSFAQTGTIAKIYKIFLNSVDRTGGKISEASFSINWRSELPQDGDGKWYMSLESFHFADAPGKYFDSPGKFFDDFIYTMDIDRVNKNVYSSKNNRTSGHLALIHGSSFNAFSSRFGAEVGDVSGLMIGDLTVSFRDTSDGRLMDFFDNGNVEWSAVICLYNYNS